MNHINYFFRAIWTEGIKLKNTIGFLSVFIFPIIIQMFLFLLFYNKPEMLINENMNPWAIYTRILLNMWTILFLPMFIAIATFYINFHEHKSNGWKHLYSLPVPKISIYTAKFVTSILLVVLTIAVLYIVNIISIKTLGALHPESKANEYSEYGMIFFLFSKMIFSTIGLIAIQFLLSLLFMNFFIPLGVGILATILTALALGWDKIIYFPYAFPPIVVQNWAKGNWDFFTQNIIFSLLTGLIVFVAGYF
ncbi:MAG: ABC transporter permease, partial [Melioribacteraceae bacterium]|nr:ABC transporter permease [Melioribacteraceae bacterium]